MRRRRCCCGCAKGTTRTRTRRITAMPPRLRLRTVRRLQVLQPPTPLHACPVPFCNSPPHSLSRRCSSLHTRCSPPPRGRGGQSKGLSLLCWGGGALCVVCHVTVPATTGVQPQTLRGRRQRRCRTNCYMFTCALCVCVRACVCVCVRARCR